MEKHHDGQNRGRRLFQPLKNQQGALGLAAAGALAILGLFYAAYSNDLPSSLDKFRQYSHDVASEHPENADPQALHQSLSAVKNTLSPSRPWFQAWDPGSWVEYLLYSQVIDAVDENIDRQAPARGPGSRGNPGQAAACGISVSPAKASPGQVVTVTVSVSSVFQSRIGRLDAWAVGCGLNQWLNTIGTSGGAASFQIPSDAGSGKLVAYFDAYLAEGGDKACHGSALVIVSTDQNDNTNDSSSNDQGGEEICHEQTCGDACIPWDFVCCSTGGYCQPGETCCGTEHCCPPGGPCCSDGNCCGPGQTCCTSAQGCCEAGETCCGSGCCHVGAVCVDGEHCCPPGYYWCTRAEEC